MYPLAANDTRTQLCIIDIKLTAEASPGYFAEVTYYDMTLAGWLIDVGLDQKYGVVPNAAIWPGSHETSNLLHVTREIADRGATPTFMQLWDAMWKDLEPVPFEVFALRVRRFLQIDVPRALLQPWNTFDWHVDSRCSFCEYLGEPRPPSSNHPHAAPHPDHCLPTAQTQNHLSRVAFISQGARLSLAQAGVSQVADLAQLHPTNPVFDRHQALRATRTVVAGRAAALETGQVSIPPQSGTSACMPQWADLHIYLSVDFDIGSAISVAFGLKAFWLEPRPFQSSLTAPRQSRQWTDTDWIVINRDLNDEQRELITFLQQIHSILRWCDEQDRQTLANPTLAGLSTMQRQAYRTKVQFYLWDSLQYEHLARVIGRHLQAILANPDVDYL